MVSEWAYAFQVKLFLGRSSEQLLFYSLWNEEHPTTARLISLRFASIIERGLCSHLSVGVMHGSKIHADVRVHVLHSLEQPKFLHPLWQYQENTRNSGRGEVF